MNADVHSWPWICSYVGLEEGDSRHYLSYGINVILRIQKQWDQAAQDLVLDALLVCMFHGLYRGSKEGHGDTMHIRAHLGREAAH